METDSQIIKFEEWNDFGMLHLITKNFYSAAFFFFLFAYFCLLVFLCCWFCVLMISMLLKVS